MTRLSPTCEFCGLRLHWGAWEHVAECAKKAQALEAERHRRAMEEEERRRAHRRSEGFPA